jgi:integrase
MAKIQKRTWASRGPTGHKVKKVAWGFTLQVGGKQERKFSADWTRDDAQQALAGRLLERDAPPAPTVPKTLGLVTQEYLDYKRGKGKRSIRQDEQILAKLKARLSADTPITEITAQRIAQYERDRVVEKSKLGRLVTPSTINRELAILRHLLRLAEEWGYIAKVPKIRLAREPEGRLRFLAEEEIPRLLAACEAKVAKSPYLLPVVTVAQHTGMRKGEILGLTWERVDFARGVLQLEHTKSGRRREVPMNRAVDEALAGLPGPKAEGFVFPQAGRPGLGQHPDGLRGRLPRGQGRQLPVP